MVATYHRKMYADVEVEYKEGMLESGSVLANNYSPHEIRSTLISPNMDIVGCSCWDRSPLLTHKDVQWFLFQKHLHNSLLLEHVVSNISVITKMCHFQLQGIGSLDQPVFFRLTHTPHPQQCQKGVASECCLHITQVPKNNRYHNRSLEMLLVLTHLW